MKTKNSEKIKYNITFIFLINIDKYPDGSFTIRNILSNSRFFKS